MVLGQGQKVFRAFLLLFVFFTVLYFFLLKPMQPDWDSIPGDLGDARFNNYILEHGYKWLTGQEKNFWDAPFFFPAKNVTAFSDNHLGTLFFYSIPRLAGFDRETSYQIWLLLICTANFFSCYFVLRGLSISYLGAIAGSILFTFSMAVFAHITHSQLLPRFMVPPALYYFYRFINWPGIKLISISLFCVLIQFYCTIYIGYFLCLCMFSLIVANTLLHPTASRNAVGAIFQRNQPYMYLAVLTLFLALLAPLFLPYYAQAKVSGMKPWTEVLSMVPRVQSYLYAPRGTLAAQVLGSSGDSLPAAGEHRLFIGFIPLASAIVILFYRFVRNGKDTLTDLALAGLVTFLVIFTMTVNLSGHTFYRVIFRLPGAGAIRAVTRVVVVEVFLFAIMLGAAVTQLEKSFAGKNRVYFMIFFTAILACTAYEQLTPVGAYSKIEAQNRSLRIEREFLSRFDRHRPFAYVPKDESDPAFWDVHLDAMMAAQDLNTSTVNGYSGNLPNEHYCDFESHYSSCGSLNNYLYNSRLTKQEIANIAIVGREDCHEDSYSFINGPLPIEAFNASFSFSPSKLILRPGKELVPFQVKNSSHVVWPCLCREKTGKYRISASCRWLGADKSPFPDDMMGGFNNRIALPHDLRPGDTVSLQAEVEAPSKPGRYFLEFSMVQEHSAWFHEKGSQTGIIEVEVR